jgi:hypothetical protein
MTSGIDLRTYVALDDVPHLRLALTAVTLHGQLVVGVYLYREVLARVDIIDETTLHSHTFVTRHAADFPTLTDIRLGSIDALERCNAITTPDGGLQKRFKLIRFHFGMCLFFVRYRYFIAIR